MDETIKDMKDGPLQDICTKKMEHCIGFNSRKVYRRKGKVYFKPYRNHCFPGGTDCQIWETLTARGFAESDEKQEFYRLTDLGLQYLSLKNDVYIYSEKANGNEVDAAPDVLAVLRESRAICRSLTVESHPISAATISHLTRLPLDLTRSTLKYLEEYGQVKHAYKKSGRYWNPKLRVVHGWLLTDKYVAENEDKLGGYSPESMDRLLDELTDPDDPDAPACCWNGDMSSRFKDGLVLCRRTKTAERVQPDHSCKYAKHRSEKS